MGHVRDRWRDPARRGKGLRWQVKYTVDGREKDGGSFDNKDIAKRKLVELEANVQRGQWVDPTDRTTVTELFRGYVATRMHKPSTEQRIDGLIRNHVEVTKLGSRRAAAVKPSEIQAWVSDRAQLLAPATTRVLVKVVRAAFSAAVLDRIVPVSPFQRIALPKVERPRVVPLTVAQVLALAALIGLRYRAMVITQAGLGLRIGELLALRVGDVDFLNRTVRIEHQIDKRTRQRVPPKTPRSRRTLPLPGVVSLELAAHIRRITPAADGLLFHTHDGAPFWHEYYTQKVFAKAVAKAKLPAGTTTHDLRHHYASTLIAAGESVVTVAELLGHENASMVLEVYAHLMPDGVDRARKAIDAAWKAEQDAPSDSATAQ